MAESSSAQTREGTEGVSEVLGPSMDASEGCLTGWRMVGIGHIL